MVDVEAGYHGLEIELLLITWLDLQKGGATTGARHSMEIDGMDHDRVLVVFHMHLHGVADPDA